MVSDIKYRVITEDGEETLTLAEYHKRFDLISKVGLITTPPAGRRTVFMGDTIVSFSEDVLASNPKKRYSFEECRRLVEENPLKYFIPQNDTALEFLNDTEHNCKGLIAGNGFGKSTIGWIDVLLDICPCDPKWPIFTVAGVKHRPYRGPREVGGVGIISYEWNNHITTIWPQIIRRWTPKTGLGEWAEGGNATISWRSNPRIEIYGTPIWFFACSQAQTVFEASAMDIYWWDEQGEEDKFNGANMRLRRRNGRHVFTLTPHKVAGRPDTGAGSWIHKLYKKDMSAGLNTRFYHSDIFSIPDWVYSEKAKKDVYQEWVAEPTKNNDIKKLREGRSRLYGEFHQSSGLVFDEWNPAVHVIEPFNIPKEWTLYRSVDHGRVNPTACLWAAVSPENDVYLYREYYKTDRTIGENVKAIIESSKNKRRLREVYNDSQGVGRKRFDEIMCGEVYRWTKLDSRSMAKKSDESYLTIGEVYRDCGLRVQPADGQTTDKQVSVAKEYFAIDADKKNPITGEAGSPRIFVFNTLVNFRKEIEAYVNEEVSRVDKSGIKIISERPRGKDDHLMTAFLYLLMGKPSFQDGQESLYEEFDNNDVDKDEQEVLRDDHCGY